MPEQNNEKSQDATPHRRQEAREQGQVARSQDLGSAVVLLGATLFLMGMGGGLVHYMGTLAERQLGGGAWISADVDFAIGQWSGTMQAMTRHVLPIMALVMLVAVVVNLAQVGFLFLPDKLAMDFTRVDPIKGMGRIFSLPGFMRLLFGMFKVFLVGAVAAISLWDERDVVANLAGTAPGGIATYIVQTMLATTLKIAVALIVLALLDYAFQRWKHEQDLRMTTQEVREEMKNLQGDPQVISRRRAVQRQLALDRLSSAVPKASVVVTNPTELAIAIQYEPETMHTPVVVAKGAGVLARRIRQLALEHDIPVIEKKPLAQAIYKQVEVNHPIPADMYSAVAEVLAYVYQLKGKTMPTRPAA